MGSRRVVTCIRESGAVRALRLAEDADFSAAPGEILVQVACGVVDLEPLRMGPTPDVPAAAFLGTVREAASPTDLKPGDLVCGVGPLAERVAVGRDNLVRLDGESQGHREHLALIPFVFPVLDALESAYLVLGERVCVAGQGLAARLSMQVAELFTGITPDAGEVDLLIDTTADAARWVEVLPSVREQGRVLLLVPPGPQVHSFDFYPMVHRRSLSLQARRVPGVGERLGGRERDIRTLLHLFGQGFLCSEGLLINIRADASDAGETLVRLDAGEARAGLAWWFEPPWMASGTY